MTVAIVDTGPLVAFLNRRDRHHGWAKAELGGLHPPLRTCEAVLSEASFLLERGGIAGSLPSDMLARGLIASSFRLDEQATRVVELMRRYADQPMSLADACLVRMAEIHSDCVVITLDSDFDVYRRNGRRRIPVRRPR